MKNKNYFYHTSYLRKSVAYDQDFRYTCVKWWYLQAFFSHFKIETSKGQKISKMTMSVVPHIPEAICHMIVKRAKNDLKYKFQSVTLYISRTVDHSIKIFRTKMKNNISRLFSLFYFFKKCNIVNNKIILFFIGPLQQFI